MKIREIKDTAEFCTIVFETQTAYKGVDLWWRGQSNKDWRLIPSLIRSYPAHFEHNMAIRFANRARVRHSKCPPSNDITGWVFLMQHYGLPTRLLDWTESALTALYFAVEDESKSNEEGGIFALEPTILNEMEMGAKCIVGAGTEDSKGIFDDVFRESKRPTSSKILGIYADHSDIRHMMQACAFTIHGKSEFLDSEKYFEKCLTKYTVSAKSKLKIKEQLRLLGFKPSTIYPDLGNLAIELKSMKYLPADQRK